MDCDLVVLGAGGAGLVAAVKASEDGVKKVIILEKAKKPGGSSYFAGGPGTASQGSNSSGGSQTAAQGALGSQGGGAQGGQSGQGRSGTVSQNPSGQFSNWFTSKVGAENFVNAPRTEKYKDLPDPSIGPGRGGTFLVDKMIGFCQKQGIQIFYETPANKFITDDKGKVTGILAVTKDGQLLVNCKACVIASGGFGRNYEKLKKYWPEEYNNKEIFFLCPPGMMGDGIDMAEEIGAYINQTKWDMSIAGGFFANGPMHHPYSWAVQSLMGSGVYINLDGKRWDSRLGGPLRDQPGGVVYSVADNDMIETSGTQMVNSRVASEPDSFKTRATKKWKEDLEYEAAIDDEGTSGNHAKKANTLVELALKMKIDPAVFLKTIEEYNKSIETGNGQGGGSQGGTRGQALKPIKTPPFWAIYGHRFSQCTKGLNGIAVNTKFEVLNPKGEAMPGLYAAGDTCTIYGGLVLQGSAQRASTAGNAVAVSGGAPAGQGGAPGAPAAASVNILSTEPSPCGGSTAAFVSGYSAGVHAAEYLKKI
jgi:succinate dehydrogenase/fumarate reductase flavoprotein subunit